MRDRKRVDLDEKPCGEGLRGTQGGETDQNTLCEKNIFNKREK